MTRKPFVGARCNVPLSKTHHRCSIRLKGYNYSQAGAYFVTVCTTNRECLFGNIADGKMQLNGFGEIIKSEWLKTSIIRKNVITDEFIVMLNHMHGIIVITDDGRDTLQGRGTSQRAPTIEHFGKPVCNSIPTIVRLFKSTTTKQINESRNTFNKPVWQRNYYEHIIRDGEELSHIREYIINNPSQWQFDRENPNSRGTLQCAPTNRNQWGRLEEKIYGKTKK